MKNKEVILSDIDQDYKRFLEDFEWFSDEYEYFKKHFNKENRDFILEDIHNMRVSLTKINSKLKRIYIRKENNYDV